MCVCVTGSLHKCTLQCELHFLKNLKKPAVKVKARSVMAPFLFLLAVYPIYMGFPDLGGSVPESAAGVPTFSSTKGPESTSLSSRAFLRWGANWIEQLAKGEGTIVNVVLSTC